MITRDDLRNLEFACFNKDRSLFYDGLFDYMFDIKTQILYSHCEVNGNIEELALIKTIEQFKELLT